MVGLNVGLLRKPSPCLSIDDVFVDEFDDENFLTRFPMFPIQGYRENAPGSVLLDSIQANS